MFERLVAGVINRMLGDFIEDVTGRDMSFGLDGMSFSIVL